ncbi:MAG TPA: methyltransferase domain-containing protein [Chloroflexia bacterium]|nr:methyltransferase domain-containing protein [Chloroflexia bacterium]
MERQPYDMEAQAEVWSRAAPTYSHVGPPYFQHFGKRLVALAPIQPGDSILDVAAGRGALLFPAAEKVGPQGEVTGVDYSEGMVQQTGAEIDTFGIKNARMARMDAEHLEFADGSFDCLLCGFALFFFPHPDTALSEFRRVLKPGGLLAVSTWGAADPRWSWLGELFGRPKREDAITRPGFDQPEAMRTIIEGAGFTDIEVVKEQIDVLFADEEEWWATSWSHGGRFALEKLAPDELARTQAYAHENLQAIKQRHGIPSTLHALFTFARKPHESSLSSQ